MFPWVFRTLQSGILRDVPELHVGEGQTISVFRVVQRAGKVNHLVPDVIVMTTSGNLVNAQSSGLTLKHVPDVARHGQRPRLLDDQCLVAQHPQCLLDQRAGTLVRFALAATNAVASRPVVHSTSSMVDWDISSASLS